MPPLREVIARHGIVARKRLGQNFLLDLNLTGRIARAAGPLEHATVVEIGPGPGALTRALLAAGARRILAIERDPRCLAALGEIAAAHPGRLELVAGDALRLDPVELSDAPRKIVANLRNLEAGRFDLKFGMPGLTHEQLMTTVELYGTEVVPRVRELVAGAVLESRFAQTR